MRFALLGLLMVACTPKSNDGAPSAPVNPVEKGRSVYVSNCIACHNADPKLDGAVGPAVAGSSLELLEQRVLKQSYPAGYAPKRSTKVMPAMVFLKDQIPALHAYLNAP